MHLVRSEYFWWITGNCLSGILAVTLYARRLYHRAPWFTGWITEAFLASLALFTVNHYAHPQTYAHVFWFFAAAEISLQIGVALEFGYKALWHAGSWLPSTKVPLISSGIASTVIALIFTTFAQPAAANIMDGIYTRLTLFSSLLVLWCAVSVLSITYARGSLWKADDLYRFIGFLVWSAASALNDTMHVYWRFTAFFSKIEAVHMGICLVVLIYWTATCFVPVEGSDPSQGRGTSGVAAVFQHIIIQNAKL